MAATRFRNMKNDLFTTNFQPFLNKIQLYYTTLVSDLFHQSH